MNENTKKTLIVIAALVAILGSLGVGVVAPAVSNMHGPNSHAAHTAPEVKGNNAGMFDRLVRELRLSGPQQESLKKTMDEVHKEIATMASQKLSDAEKKEKTAAILGEARKKIAAGLDAEQKKKFDEMFKLQVKEHGH